MQLAFPMAKRFEDIFEQWTPDQANKPHPWIWQDGGQKGFGGPWSGATTRVGPYCTVGGDTPRRSLWVRLRPEVFEWVRANMLCLGGAINFNVVVRQDGRALVVVQYDQIIGSRWLAEIDGASIPTEEGKAHVESAVLGDA